VSRLYSEQWERVFSPRERYRVVMVARERVGLNSSGNHYFPECFPEKKTRDTALYRCPYYGDYGHAYLASLLRAVCQPPTAARFASWLWLDYDRLRTVPSRDMATVLQFYNYTTSYSLARLASRLALDFVNRLTGTEDSPTRIVHRKWLDKTRCTNSILSTSPSSKHMPIARPGTHPKEHISHTE